MSSATASSGVRREILDEPPERLGVGDEAEAFVRRKSCRLWRSRDAGKGSTARTFLLDAPRNGGRYSAWEKVVNSGRSWAYRMPRSPPPPLLPETRDGTPPRQCRVDSRREGPDSRSRRSSASRSSRRTAASSSSRRSRAWRFSSIRCRSGRPSRRSSPRSRSSTARRAKFLERYNTYGQTVRWTARAVS